MKNTYNNIDDLLRDSYEGHSVPEYKNTWSVLKVKLRKYYFFKFSATHLNIYYSVAFVGISALILATVFYSGVSDDSFSLEPTSAPTSKTEPVIIQSEVSDVEVAKNVEKPSIFTNDMPQESQEKNIQSHDRIIDNSNRDKITDNVKPESEEPSYKVHYNNSIPYSDSAKVKSAIDSVETISHDTIKVVRKIQKVYVPQKQVVVKDTVVKVVKRRRTKR